MAEHERVDLPETGSDGLAEAPAEQTEGRAVKRAPHPAWRILQVLLSLLLMTGATWALYHGLVYVAGPPIKAPVREFDPDPAGFALISNLRVQPLPEGEGEGVLITWTAENLGAKSWSASTHHWEPLSASLPPLPLPRPIPSGESAKMAVRLRPPYPTVIGWQLMGLKGPVENGQIEVSISPVGERK